MDPICGYSNGKYAAYTATALERSTAIKTAEERHGEAVGVIEDGQKEFIVPEEAVCRSGDVSGAVPGVEDALHPSALTVEGPSFFGFATRRNASGALGYDEAVIAVPGVRPEAVAS